MRAGWTIEKTEHFIITAATDTTKLNDTSLGWAEVSSILARSKARVIVLLDACQSGFAGRELVVE